jgi:hypothetical protein
MEPDDVTRGRAEAELLHARGAIAELIGDSKDFARLIAGRTVSYELFHGQETGALRLATWGEGGFAYEWR